MCLNEPIVDPVGARTESPLAAQIRPVCFGRERQIIFTSGATESNNMSIKGVARFYKGRKKHIITTQTEHKCVLDSCRAMEQEGYEVKCVLDALRYSWVAPPD